MNIHVNNEKQSEQRKNIRIAVPGSGLPWIWISMDISMNISMTIIMDIFIDTYK